MRRPRLRPVLPAGPERPCDIQVVVHTWWHTRRPYWAPGRAIAYTPAAGGIPGQVQVAWRWAIEDGGDGDERADWFDARQVMRVGME